jgi:hypothetical protein
MERISHGALLLDSNQPAPVQPGAPVSDGNVPCPPRTNFDYLFPNNPTDRLPDQDDKGRPMVETLIRLGNSQQKNPPAFMIDSGVAGLDSQIPSVYTYFGQFITHEIVLEVTTQDTKLGPESAPLDKAVIPTLENARTTQLDLDSVYGPMLDNRGKCFPVPMKGEELALSFAGLGNRFPDCDLKREHDPPFAALIGDRRNDSNLIISQMHLAFVRAHNALIKQQHSFPEAQKLLRQHFQWLVISDYLPRVVDGDVLTSVLNGEIDVFKSARDRSAMPVEFSAAAFRFAHSMPRSVYNYNKIHDQAELSELFLPIPQYSRLLEAWIIDWERFIPGGQNMARLIDTRLVQPLFRLIDSRGKPVLDSKGQRIGIAALDLLRGYLLGLPTGQAVARQLGEPAISANEIEDAAGRIVQDDIAANQKAILADSGLSTQTPLWFYILAEAAVQKNGACLGRVGSTIVAGVLIDMVSRSIDSIFHDPNWHGPSLGNGNFDLAELFRLAEVLPSNQN